MLETIIISNNILPVPLQEKLYAVDQIVPEFSNNENAYEPAGVVEKDKGKAQVSHDDFVEACESYNIEYYDAKKFYRSDSDYLMPNKGDCEFEVGSILSEFFNTLFDEDADINQPMLCLNIYEKGFHIISNPLYEEEVENIEIVKIDQNVNAELISCDEDQFPSMTGYDGNVEGISDTYGDGIYNKEGAIQADQRI